MRPENIELLPSLQQGLREHTHVDVTCSVQQVKPRPRLFWRIGDTLPMHKGSGDDRVTGYSNGTFSVRSSYSFEARRQDDDEFLQCIVVNERDSEEELGRERKRLSVHCEYTQQVFFGYLGSAHRVFNLHVLLSCASSIFTCFSFEHLLITSLHLSVGFPIFRCPPPSMFSLLILIVYAP